MLLDVDFVRKQFDQINDDPNLVFASNAGGSYVCNQVNEVFERYNRHTRVQPYSNFSPSNTAGEAMDRAKRAWAQALNIKQSELTIGPSTSMNTYVMSHAISADWGPGDEIVVCNQDHEANIGSWCRVADAKGVKIRLWQANKDDGLLDVERLLPLLNTNTKWVFFNHCSNLIGTTNPVKEITKLVRQHCAARVFVDAVAHAPHQICDLKDLGIDAYVFSLYKVFGPHQSLLYTSSDLQSELTSQAHFFLGDDVSKWVNPAGPQHAQVAACAGVIDYFELLHSHHFGDSVQSMNEKLISLHKLIHGHESQLAKPIIEFLSNRSDVRLLGKPHIDDDDRAPTIAFKPLKQSSASLASKLQAVNIGTENGDFYAHRLVKTLGIEPNDGVVRISLLHYNLLNDANTIVAELDAALG